MFSLTKAGREEGGEMRDSVGGGGVGEEVAYLRQTDGANKVQCLVKAVRVLQACCKR